MGELVLVEHREIGRTFVARILQRGLAGDSVLMDRIRLEAQVLGALEPPNTVSVVGRYRTAGAREHRYEG